MLFWKGHGDSSVSSVIFSFPQGKHWSSHHENLLENFISLYSDIIYCHKLTTPNQYHQIAFPFLMPA